MQPIEDAAQRSPLIFCWRKISPGSPAILQVNQQDQ
jgi:hypothetical protein